MKIMESQLVRRRVLWGAFGFGLVCRRCTGKTRYSARSYHCAHTAKAVGVLVCELLQFSIFFFESFDVTFSVEPTTNQSPNVQYFGTHTHLYLKSKLSHLVLSCFPCASLHSTAHFLSIVIQPTLSYIILLCLLYELHPSTVFLSLSLTHTLSPRLSFRISFALSSLPPLHLSTSPTLTFVFLVPAVASHFG